MQRSIWPRPAVLVLVPSLCSFQAPAERAPFDLGPGIELVDLVPRSTPLPPAALERVASHVDRPVAELEGARLFTVVLRARGGPEERCDVVSLPLAGPARGGRVDLAVGEGGLVTVSVWGTLDLDADPTGRWGVFLQQLQSSWSQERPRRLVTLATPPAREVERRLADQEGETARLARALVDQRIAMRKNASLNLIHDRKLLPRPEWVADLAEEMKRLARSARELTPLVGEDGARRHAELATELAFLYEDLRSLLESETDAKVLRPDLDELAGRVSATCRSCHTSHAGGREAFTRRRIELGLGETLLRVGYDVAPALGDDGKVSAEIADKVRAGMLLVEAAR